MDNHSFNSPYGSLYLLRALCSGGVNPTLCYRWSVSLAVPSSKASTAASDGIFNVGDSKNGFLLLTSPHYTCSLQFAFSVSTLPLSSRADIRATQNRCNAKHIQVCLLSSISLVTMWVSIHLSVTASIQCTHVCEKHTNIPWDREERCFHRNAEAQESGWVVSYTSMSHTMINDVLLKWFQFPLFSQKSHSPLQQTAPHSPSTDKRCKGNEKERERWRNPEWQLERERR